ncbi:MAG: hypothetical protein ABSD89_02830 [Halobacteriota archaeon]
MAHRLSLHRLPAPLTFYVQINALSESHLRQVAKLKDVYGPDLLRDLSQWKWTYPPAGDSAVWASILLNALRPEEWAVACLRPNMVKDSVVRGCKTFASYVVRRGKTLPQWVIAAFWWESMAAQGEMSEEDLALLIEGWKDRFQNAVSWWMERGANPPNALPRERDDALLWRCFYSDLWHSGALDEQTNTISPMLKLSGMRLVPRGHKSRGRLPSAVQAGIAKYVSREPDEN